MSALGDTNLAIRAGMLADRRRRAEEERAMRPMRMVDAIVGRLEELHLAGRKRVPETLDGHLAELQAGCPVARGYDLRSRITIVHLMDQLYEIQELLLEAKAGLDAALEGDPGPSLSAAS